VLLDAATRAGIANGTIRAVYRRWKTPRVAAGSTFKTAIGVVAMDAIEAAALAKISERDARDAGFASRDALLAQLDRHREGRLYRIALRLAGPDPRLALRAQSRLSKDDVADLSARIAKFGASSASGPWAIAVLELIDRKPAVRAGDLAVELGMERLRFKQRVRQLKELGLTESLDVGYRLSPRGRALLRQLSRSAR
jgi:hypothetical protein